MRTNNGKMPYRWFYRNERHSLGFLAHEMLVPRQAGVWQFTGRNRAITRALRAGADLATPHSFRVYNHSLRPGR